MGRPARSSLVGELAANARRLFISGDVVRGFLDGATAAEVRAANRLLSAELESRDVHRRERLMRRARFPQVKSFEGYDYSQVAFPDGYGPADLESLSFLDTAEGFVFHGRTGRGKTHGALRDAANADLVILDEFGYVPIDVAGARLLFQVVSDCYERRSLVITTNIEFGKWGTVLGDDKLAAAMIDRVVHHSRLVEFNGTSHRMDQALMLSGNGN